MLPGYMAEDKLMNEICQRGFDCNYIGVKYMKGQSSLGEYIGFLTLLLLLVSRFFK